MSKLYKLNPRDFFDGMLAAMLTAILWTVGGVVKEGFDLFSADWIEIGKSVLNASFIAFVAYIGKIFVTDENGKTVGKI